MAIRALGAKLVGKQICLEDLCMIDIKCSEPIGDILTKLKYFLTRLRTRKTFNPESYCLFFYLFLFLQASVAADAE